MGVSPISRRSCREGCTVSTCVSLNGQILNHEAITERTRDDAERIGCQSIHPKNIDCLPLRRKHEAALTDTIAVFSILY